MKRRPVSRNPDSALWAVCCLFNPCGYKRRLSNYHLFRSNLPVPLLTVELSFDGAFALRADDADLLVQINGGAVLWQKERLLNRGVAHLPAACTAVAVLDADLIFKKLDWPQAALAALDTVPVVQLFSEVLHMPDRWKPGEPAMALTVQYSLTLGLQRGYSLVACLGAQAGDGRGAYCGGFAHAYRRTLLDARGLFDANIVGGGDTAMAAASFGVCEIAEARHAMTAAHRRAYRGWAEPWCADVRGMVGHIEGRVGHLWHGDLIHRAAHARHALLAAHDYDPARDIACDDNGAWRWASDKPAMHRALADYFALRREDGG